MQVNAETKYYPAHTSSQNLASYNTNAARAPIPPTNPETSNLGAAAFEGVDVGAVEDVVGAPEAESWDVIACPDPPTLAREAGTDMLLVGETLSLTLTAEGMVLA